MSASRKTTPPSSCSARKAAASALLVVALLSRRAAEVRSFPFRPPPPVDGLRRCRHRRDARAGGGGGGERGRGDGPPARKGGLAPTTTTAAAVAAAAATASLLLLLRPLSAGADGVDAPSPPPPPPRRARNWDMGSSSIVFDAMDEVPPIEEAVMNGSRTTIVTLRGIPPERCLVTSAFGDLVEIEYVAKKLDPPAQVYDASVFRGTGQPFKFVLGSGVMTPGVDQGLYGMCPGEVRLLKVPPKLAAGLLDPPAKAPLEWRVELVSIEGIVREGNNDELTREERNMGEE